MYVDQNWLWCSWTNDTYLIRAVGPQCSCLKQMWHVLPLKKKEKKKKSQAANKQHQYFVVAFIVYMMSSLMALGYVKKPEVPC